MFKSKGKKSSGDEVTSGAGDDSVSGAGAASGTLMAMTLRMLSPVVGLGVAEKINEVAAVIDEKIKTLDDKLNLAEGKPLAETKPSTSDEGSSATARDKSSPAKGKKPTAKSKSATSNKKKSATSAEDKAASSSEDTAVDSGDRTPTLERSRRLSNLSRSSEFSDISNSSDSSHYEFGETIPARAVDDSVIGTDRAKNVRNVLSFFKRKTSETPIPPLEEIKSWSRSITNLLYDKYGLMLFKSFLCSEYSEENIDFWIACEEYKQIKGKNFSVRAEKLYGDYVTVHAPKEVNLDSKTRMETMQALPYADQNTFDAAQEKIQSLMEKDSYTRFLRSKVYTTLLSSGSSSAA